MKYYHLSGEYHGLRPTFTPRIPFGACKDYENVTTPRVCFAPSIVQCLYAIMAHEFIDENGKIDEYALRRSFAGESGYFCGNFAIYTTQKKLEPAGRVADKKITGEMWSRKPIRVYFEGFLSMSAFIRDGKIKLAKKLTRTDREIKSCL